MQYKMTAKFIFHNRTQLTVNWIESEKMKEGKDSTGAVGKVPLSVDEVEMHFRSVFLKYMKSKDRLSIPSITGYVEIIPFEEVFRMAFKVEEYKGGSTNA
ncbi:hypothetical protein IAQ67_28775 (plasmid) [Paenibacillus peoriae]|uniref:Uncharacterized protein n=1 Tax=Paenibacillus peoriae TaxID=59893 RepID=A0A7H0YGZ4_9BACL|nr:hypothetical protein [Paenibacillus peoriae]QNR70352.1 hypothetical protein IAQ67_28775 [Paenibacillus peoriae]